MALLEVKDVSKLYKTRSPRKKAAFAAVDGVSLSVGDGKCVGLVGESGCGKSTLAHLILGIETPSAGSITFNGHTVEEMKKNGALRQGLQMVYQDSSDAVNYRITIADIIGEPLENFYGLKGEERRERVKKLLERVDLTEETMDKYPRQFSMGQLQRVCIARALASDPKLIIMDEPLSSLDVSVQAQILNELKDLKTQLGLSYLLISHDLEAVYYLSDSIYVMYGGRIMESIEDIGDFDSLVHPYSKKLLDSCPAYINLEDDTVAEAAAATAEFSSGCPYAARCERAQEKCFAEKPELFPVKPGHMVACHELKKREEKNEK